MAIILSGTTNDITVNGVSVATDAEVSSAVAPKANTSDVNTLEWYIEERSKARAFIRANEVI